ncbi:hypothetical protein ACROYT_G028418 [Oculina patagonica]
MDSGFRTVDSGFRTVDSGFRRLDSGFHACGFWIPKDLLQPALFSLYGNQYELREEHLLLTMFQLALKYEVNESETFNSLLRANTAISRMMTTYTRRGPGQEYLKSTLGALIANVADQDKLVLEINPLKVYAEIYGTLVDSSGQLTMERAMDDSGVQDTIQEHILFTMIYDLVDDDHTVRHRLGIVPSDQPTDRLTDRPTGKHESEKNCVAHV